MAKTMEPLSRRWVPSLSPRPAILKKVSALLAKSAQRSSRENGDERYCQTAAVGGAGNPRILHADRRQMGGCCERPDHRARGAGSWRDGEPLSGGRQG